MAYKFNKGVDTSGEWPVLPEGDYKFSLTSCSMPEETEKGYDHIEIELLVEGQKVWDHRYAGTNDKGEFDMISPFLVAINRIPKQGQEKSPAFWTSLSGTKGTAYIICESYQGKTRNKVKYYHAPKQVGPTAQGKPQDFSEAEIERSQARIAQVLGVQPETEPDDIPF